MNSLLSSTYLVEKGPWLVFIAQRTSILYSKGKFQRYLDQYAEKNGRGIHDWGKVCFSIENNACHFDHGTAKQFQALLEDADDDMAVFIQRCRNVV